MDSNMTFGLICEGLTDQEVIWNILYGYTGDKRLAINPVQPRLDRTSRNKPNKNKGKEPTNYAGWGEVFNYCKSANMALALKAYDFLIVEIDTDAAEQWKMGISLTEGGKDKDPDIIVSEVADKILGLLDAEAFALRHKIIFAIAIHSIECWLLPLYANNGLDSTKNCLKRLNEAKPPTSVKKEKGVYDKLSKDYKTPKELKKYYPLNPSFAIFIKNLDEKLNPKKKLRRLRRQELVKYWRKRPKLSSKKFPKKRQ